MPIFRPSRGKGGYPMGYFSVSVMGKDRPGIVAEVTRILYERGVNIEDSTRTILCGQFAMILVVFHATLQSASEVSPSFDEVRREMGLLVTVHSLKAEEVVHEKSVAGEPPTTPVHG